MERARVQCRRRAAHALVLSFVALGMLACHVASQGSGSAVISSAPDDPAVSPHAPSDSLPQTDAATPSPAADEPTQAQTPLPAPRFASPVERWRPMSRDAAQTAQQVTGVNLDENILLALVAVESEGKPAAHSPRGAVGLAQVEPGTFAELRARYGKLLAGGSLEQPRVNLLAGALYLAECARFLGSDVAVPNDLALVLHAYNMGPRAAAEWRDTGSWVQETDGGVPQLEHELPPETVEHASRIMDAIYAASALPGS